jgi:exonuclease SbcD
MSYRLLHVADLHLDRAFAAMGCQGPLARRRRQGLRDALRRTGELAREELCSAVSIAGDLYEHERAGVDTGDFLAETFASWRPLRVFVAPGNHDALMPGSLYRRVEWPDNVHIFAESQLRPVQLEDGLTLWGLAHREPAWAGNPLDCDTVSAGSGVHVALFHGAEVGSRPEGKSIHGPFRVEQIRERGFVAALSGHYHRRRLDEDSGLLYPGSPEPLTYDETGGRGPVVVGIEARGEVTFSARDVNRWSVFTVSAGVGDCASQTSVTDLVLDAVVAAVGDAHRDTTMVRVDLVGDLDGSVSVDSPALEHVVREHCDLAAVAIRDLTSPRIDLDVLSGEQSTRGTFTRMAAAAIDEALARGDQVEADELRDALRYGLAALSGMEVGLR